MELCANGDLFDWANQGIFEIYVFLRKAIFQMLSAVNYLHSRSIAHMDLKPENILLDSDFNIKLTDFGCCETNIPKSSEDFFGTLYYSAPEVLNGTIIDPRKADIWSLGVIIYSMATGELPWLSGSEEYIRKQIKSGNYRHPGDISPSLANLISQCLSLDPSNRPSAAKLLENSLFVPEKRCNAITKIPASRKIEHQGKFIRNSLSIAKPGGPKIIRPQGSIIQKPAIAFSFSNATIYTPKLSLY